MTAHINKDEDMNLSPSSNDIYLQEDSSSRVRGEGSWDHDPRHQQDEMHHFFVEKDDSQDG